MIISPFLAILTSEDCRSDWSMKGAVFAFGFCFLGMLDEEENGRLAWLATVFGDYLGQAVCESWSEWHSANHAGQLSEFESCSGIRPRHLESVGA